ncbi:hypothetical protein D9M72_421610 [compost metagenome]
MHVLRLQLVAQHLGGELPVRGQRLEPGEDGLLQALAVGQGGPTFTRGSAHERKVGPFEPGLSQVVFLPVMPMDLVQADAHVVGDVMQVQGVPTAALAQHQGDLQDPAGQGCIVVHGVAILGNARQRSTFQHREAARVRARISLPCARCCRIGVQSGACRPVPGSAPASTISARGLSLGCQSRRHPERPPRQAEFGSGRGVAWTEAVRA